MGEHVTDNEELRGMLIQAYLRLRTSMMQLGNKVTIEFPRDIDAEEFHRVLVRVKRRGSI